MVGTGGTWVTGGGTVTGGKCVDGRETCGGSCDNGGTGPDPGGTENLLGSMDLCGLGLGTAGPPGKTGANGIGILEMLTGGCENDVLGPAVNPVDRAELGATEIENEEALSSVSLSDSVPSRGS